MSAPPDILAIANEYREALILLEREVTAEILEAYEGIRQRLEGDLDVLTARITARLNAGDEIPVSWLHRQDRYQQLLDQAEDEVARLAQALNPRLAELQSNAAILGDESARAMLGNAGIQITARLPNEALVELVGRLSDGSPLSEWLDQFGPVAREKVAEALTDAVARGVNPRLISRQLSLAIGFPETRMLTLVRTETISSYRNANLAQYRQHSDVLVGWRWSATLGDPRTCASCLAQHGKVFPLSEPFASHPNCRCVPQPWTGQLSGITGPEWFAEQPASFQSQFFDSDAKYRAYRDGVISLEDLIQTGTDPRWGPWSREMSLANALPSKLADQYYAEAAGG